MLVVTLVNSVSVKIQRMSLVEEFGFQVWFRILINILLFYYTVKQHILLNKKNMNENF